MERTRGTVIAALALTCALLVAVPAAGAAVPAAVTGPVSGLTATTATVTGTVTPGGQSTTWYVEYGTSTSYGKQTASRSAGSGTSAVDVSVQLTGLEPGTTYDYRVVATNSSGTSRGANGIFSTPALPGATTGSATSIGADRATLGGTVDPNGLETSWYVEYGTSTAYGKRSATQSAGSGTTARSVSVQVTGLDRGVLYHYRVVAESTAGSARGADATFRTLAPPSVITGQASSVTPTSARLNGSVDPNGLRATVWFEYGPTTAYGSRTRSQDAGSGVKRIDVSASVSGLKPGLVYHFRLVGKNETGTLAGGDATFTTGAPPSVTTATPTGIGSSTATLQALVNPNGRRTSVSFEYGTTTRYGTRTPARDIGDGSKPVPVAVVVAGLSPGTAYHVRAVATSSGGTATGGDVAFRTAVTPSVATGPVTALGPTVATLAGTVNPAGRDTSWWVEYGPSRSFGLRTAPATLPTGTLAVPVTAELTGLTPGIRWFYRFVARSSAGTAFGATASFGTPATPRGPGGRPVRCTITGTQGPDRLRGTSGRDVICGLGGDDVLDGGGGDDVLVGGPGNDRLLGGAGSDTLVGGLGEDELVGRVGADRLEGGDGSDRLVAGAGVDVVLAAAGNDVIVGGTGRDRLYGGAGADLLFARDGYRDVVDGGPGLDLATLDRLDRARSVRPR
jgi:Ca2+-binding RTX toxin-like protein